MNDEVKSILDLLDLLSKGTTPYPKGEKKDSKKPIIAERPSSFPIEVYDDKDAYTIAAPFPGYDKEEISIDLCEDKLTIKAIGKTPKNVVQSEFNGRGGFERSLALSHDIDTAKVTATMDKGILYIKLGKIEAPKPKKIIIG